MWGLAVVAVSMYLKEGTHYKTRCGQLTEGKGNIRKRDGLKYDEISKNIRYVTFRDIQLEGSQTNCYIYRITLYLLHNCNSFQENFIVN